MAGETDAAGPRMERMLVRSPIELFKGKPVVDAGVEQVQATVIAWLRGSADAARRPASPPARRRADVLGDAAPSNPPADPCPIRNVGGPNVVSWKFVEQV
jgi:hypothetical protein